MEIIANDLPLFDQDITDYQSAKQSLEKNYELLVTHMNDLNSMWTGEAHDAFISTFQADSAKVADMVDALNEIYNELRFAHSEYTSCENAVSGIIEEIPV